MSHDDQTDDQTDDPMRDFARRLFADDEDQQQTKTEPVDLKAGNRVPNEGNTPSRRRGDEDLRSFAAALFGTDH